MEIELPSAIAFDFLNGKLRKFLAKGSTKWKESGPWRFPAICYTLEHKLAFLEREHYLTGHYSLRGILHDLDKPFYYLNPFFKDKKKIQELHRKNSCHHAGCVETYKLEHLIEMYIDWDCAALTKPDKPLNAFETLVHFYPEFMNIMLPLCLALEPESVKAEIFLHPWHKLCLDKHHNTDVYSEVKSIVYDIARNFPLSFDEIEKIKQSYQKKPRITECSATEIFILMLLKQKENLKIEIDFSKALNTMYAIYATLAKKDCFAGIPEVARKGVSGHHYKEIKKCPYKDEEFMKKIKKPRLF
ncbi:MAG: hypothetical protein J6C85_08010 [Alphaproteobacteria bacterium]|nr:hypothetical protein [Alphaproteobacteria bacterium]